MEEYRKNIWQNIENPKKFMLILYFGRDARGKMKKSSKTMYGTLTEARNMLKQHDVDRLHESVNVPTKCTLKDVIEDWNRNIGDINTEKKHRLRIVIYRNIYWNFSRKSGLIRLHQRSF